MDDESEQGYEAEAGGAEGSEGGGGGEAAAAASVALESDLAQLQVCILCFVEKSWAHSVL